MTSLPFSRRTTRRRAVLPGLAALVLAACADSGTEVQTFPLDVTVEYPATYATRAAVGARVLLTNTQTNTADTATTDAQGTARFLRVLPGNYVLSASRDLSADDAFTLTGQRTAVTLNAINPVVSLLAAPSVPLRLTLAGSRLGDLVIKEVYYTGSRTPSGGTYFSDQFIEIYNNSTDTIYTDGLAIADVFGVAGQINPTNVPTPFQSDVNNVYVSSIWQIPGTGRQHPLAPGSSVLIAQDGINHRDDPLGNPNSPVNLGTADWETYNERPDGRDLDSPTVPNLTRVTFRGGFDWLLPVFGPGVVIFRAPNLAALDSTLVPGTTQTYVTRVPTALVIDAFEALQNGNSASYKRVPAALDAGFVFASGTYTSESARRKTRAIIAGRRILQDGNNSGNDFTVVTPPTPRGFGAP
jgi:hypothetical protein